MKKSHEAGTLIEVVRSPGPETFLRFATECEAMVKLARTRESKETWRSLAAIWSRYAELVERQSATAHDTKRHQKPDRGSPRAVHAEAAA
jgi:hypothetical protein